MIFMIRGAEPDENGHHAPKRTRNVGALFRFDQCGRHTMKSEWYELPMTSAGS